LRSARGCGSCRSKGTGALLQEVSFAERGDQSDILRWLDQNASRVEPPREGSSAYRWLGGWCPVDEVRHHWGREALYRLSSILCAFLDVEKRLQTADPPPAVDVLEGAPQHPIHVVYAHDDIEKKVSQHFRSAFGMDLIVDRVAGNTWPLHCGERPALRTGEDRVSRGYVERLRELPLLHKQGHGMRSFAGCVLHTIASPAFIQLIDEPEAFLHPAQARLLGALLVKEKPEWRQMIIATHSGDFLRGLLDAEPEGLKVIRLVRNGNVNEAHELDVAEIGQLWSDPILRFSNPLDGLFHEQVVVCEADADCRFYAAILDALHRDDAVVRPDIMFTASGGKQRMPVVASSLARLGVTTRVIGDFDVLREEHPLRGIVEALGGNWEELRDDWRVVKHAVEQMSPPLRINQVRDRINEILNATQGTNLPDDVAEKVRETLRRTSPWSAAKLSGVSAVPSGQPRTRANTLLEKLRVVGLFVVECGEVERFAPSVGGHGPSWVAEALKKDLLKDPELRAAREFVARVLGRENS